jgi:hypothetical protein
MGRTCSKVGETRNAYRISMAEPLGNVDFEDREEDGRITLRWILEK